MSHVGPCETQKGCCQSMAVTRGMCALARYDGGPSASTHSTTSVDDASALQIWY